MALLNPVDQTIPYAARPAVRINWRLLLALSATLGFWVALGEGLVSLLRG